MQHYSEHTLGPSSSTARNTRLHLLHLAIVTICSYTAATSPLVHVVAMLFGTCELSNNSSCVLKHYIEFLLIPSAVKLM